MSVEFDSNKDAANIAKHGISLARAADMDVRAIVEDTRRNYGEIRSWAFGFIDGVAHCLTFTMRGTNVRAISLRRARAKEIKRYVP